MQTRSALRSFLEEDLAVCAALGLIAFVVLSSRNDAEVLLDVAGGLAMAWVAAFTIAVPSQWPTWLLGGTALWVTLSPVSFRLLGLVWSHPLTPADDAEIVCGLCAYLAAMLKADRAEQCARSGVPRRRRGIAAPVSYLRLVHSSDHRAPIAKQDAADSDLPRGPIARPGRPLLRLISGHRDVRQRRRR